PPLAASIRQNIPFPAAPPAHPGACEHWHHITDQSPIRLSSTTAATTPLSSPALSSQRSSQNHPPLQPLRRQIPIVGQALTAFPRVPSSEAFRCRPLTPGSTIRARPASDTLTVSGRSRRCANERVQTYSDVRSGLCSTIWEPRCIGLVTLSALPGLPEY